MLTNSNTLTAKPQTASKEAQEVKLLNNDLEHGMQIFPCFPQYLQAVTETDESVLTCTIHFTGNNHLLILLNTK
jgi:hypothetical protein